MTVVPYEGDRGGLVVTASRGHAGAAQGPVRGAGREKLRSLTPVLVLPVASIHFGS